MFLQDYFAFMEMEPLSRHQSKNIPFPKKIKLGFRFENVGFQYPSSDRWIIRNLNFRLSAGEKLALVGENGAGKTTLVKLIARLYEPTEGTIYLDDIDIRDYETTSYHQAIGVIFQDYVRYYFTAAENIAVGDIDKLADQQKIKNAAEASLADQVVEKLPERYKQLLGRRFSGGKDLSGGEWQKIALARAYMKEAQLLILDEPTATLDARAEFEAFQRFAQLTSGKTAVIISHRFSTVRMADRIMVLRDGKIHEIGSHEELIAANGLYAELFNLQAAGYQ
jgi:ATP-binding cassette subfamily B protein